MTNDVAVRDDGVASDAALIAAVRSGDQQAVGALYQRHSGAAWVVARQYCDSKSDADDIVADAFAAVFAALGRGHGPDQAFRAYLYTVVRRVAGVRREAGRRVQPTDDVATLEAGTALAGTAEDPVLADFERGVVARAFHSLPERWQAVLWHTEVEGLSPARVAPMLGMTANGVAALAYRAREGLREAYLQQHLGDALDDGCRQVAGKLGAYVRGGLSARDEAKVAGHVEGCGECRALVLELNDVNHGMRAVVAPLVLGIAGLGALSHVLPVGGGLAAGLLAALHTGGPGSGVVGLGAAGAGAVGVGAGGGATVLGAASAGATGAGVAGAGASGVGVVSAIGGVGSGAAGGTIAGAGALGAAGAASGGAAAVGGAGAVVAAGAAGAAGASAAAVGGVAATVGGMSGLLASVPLGIVGVTAGGLVMASAAVAGTMALAGGGLSADQVVASPSVSAAPSPGPTDPSSPAPTVPAVSPTDLPTVDPLAPTTPPSAGTAVVPALVTPSTAPDPTPPDATPLDPTSPATPTAPVPTDPSPPPDPSPPLPSPPDVSVALPPGGLALAAGVPDQTLAFSVTNAGDEPAGDLVADVSLPAGVGVAGLSIGSGAAPVTGRFAPVGADGWVCAAGDDATDARCTLDALPGHTTVQLALRVGVDESFAQPSGVVDVRITGDGIAVVVPPISVTVQPAPGRLALRSTPVPPAFVTGVPTALRLDLVNVGGSTADVSARVVLPRGLRLVDASPAWRCAGRVGTVTCTRTGVGPRTATPLALRLVAGPPAAVQGRAIVVTPAPAGRSAAAFAVPFTVQQPVLTVDGFVPKLGQSSGTVSFRVTNAAGADSATARHVVVTIRLPRALVADPRGIDNRPGSSDAARPWCEVRARDTLLCVVPDLAPGRHVDVVADVLVRGAAVGRVVVEARATGAAVASAAGTVRTASGALTGRARFTGGWASTEVGAPLLSCDARRFGCRLATGAGTADDNDLAMRPIDAAADPPVPPRGVAVAVSSSTRLTVPAGRTIAFAGLYWSADRAARDVWSGPLGSALLRGPSGQWSRVEVASPSDTSVVTDSAGRTYYQSFADVTSKVADGLRDAPGDVTTWSLADAAVSVTRRDPAPTYYAGWALVVVYADEASSATVTVFDGAAWVTPGVPPAAFRFVADPGAEVRVGVVAWEGDRTRRGDRLRLGGADGTDLTPLRRGGPGRPSNAFESTATGWGSASSLGVDAKGFVPVPLAGAVAGSVGSLTATTATDQYLIGAVTVRTVPAGAGAGATAVSAGSQGPPPRAFV